MITYHDVKQANRSTSNYSQVKQACRCHTEIYIFWKEYSFECMLSSYSTFLEIHMHASEEKVLCYKAYSRCHCPCHWHVREEKKNTCITGGYELKMILFVLDCDFGLRYLDHNLGVSKRHQSGTPNTVVNATASLLYSMFRIQNITKTHNTVTLGEFALFQQCLLCLFFSVLRFFPQFFSLYWSMTYFRYTRAYSGYASYAPDK